MKFLMTLATLMMTMTAFAGIDTYNGTTHIGVVSTVTCNTGLTCAKNRTGITMTVATSSTGKKNVATWATPTLTSGTSVTPSATTVYLASVHLTTAQTLTGIKINNAATVGTNKYIVALFNSAGVKVATSALAGVLTAGANVYQAIPFTATYTPVPGLYWIGVYVNGTTDTFFSIPAVGEYAGYTGTVTGQTFGTVVNITPPTTFTAGVGPIAFTY